jgi:hypothetical protein
MQSPLTDTPDENSGRLTPGQGVSLSRIGNSKAQKAGGALLQRSVDRRELGAEFTTETVYGGNDRKRNASGDQSVLNGRCATFVC